MKPRDDGVAEVVMKPRDGVVAEVVIKPRDVVISRGRGIHSRIAGTEEGNDMNN